MTNIDTPQRLHGKSVFLSASVPDPARDERFSRIPDAAFQIEQAVVSLARAVFSEGGRLVFGGHPSISPLVATVAGEYRAPNLAEGGGERSRPQVAIYQSEAFRESLPQDTDLLIRLGLADEHWIEAVEGERFIPGQGSAHDQCPRSLQLMRERLLTDTDPVAMVCIGGMDGVLIEADMFGSLPSHRPIFTLAYTGGAASLLPEEEGHQVVPIDVEVTRELPLRGEDESELAKGEIKVHPYPLIMQTIIDRIAPPTERDIRHG